MMAEETVIFEHEAEATRDRIAATMEDLQNRLSPRTIVNNAVDHISASGSEAISSVRGMITAHPLAMAIGGLALGISLLARSKIRGARIEYGDSYAAYADYDDGYAANLADDDRGDVGPARARIDALQHHANLTVGDNPLAVILVGMATGALLGALAPVSETENNIFGDARIRLTSAARAAAQTARDEFDVSKLSLSGGPAGIVDRASKSFDAIAQSAHDEFMHKPASGISG